jgi:site-specific DNA-methyltransferase (adenine-specific)
MNRLPRNQLLVGDVRNLLPTLPAESVDCIITSPPYFRLRNYHDRKQIGLEPNVDGWVQELRRVLVEAARILKPTGGMWLNVGDTYSRHERQGAKPKSLVLGPERLAIALVEDGWIVRSKVIWAKTNPMPTSVRDRLACTHEVLYFAVRSRHYYFDLDAIRVPHRSKRSSSKRAGVPPKHYRPDWAGPLAGSNGGLDRQKTEGVVGHPLGKNPGDVWQLATANYRGAHHAVFPADLISRPLLASCPERVCGRCGQPWQREPVRRLGQLALRGQLVPTCSCGAPWQPGLVLDPFMGAGTVAIAAEAHQRDWLGIELNPTFAALARKRLTDARATAARGEHDVARAA